MWEPTGRAPGIHQREHLGVAPESLWERTGIDTKKQARNDSVTRARGNALTDKPTSSSRENASAEERPRNEQQSAG